MFSKLTHLPFVRALWIAITIAMLFVLPVLAQDGAPPVPDLSGALKALATGGAAAVVAVLFSWLSEQIPAFGTQKPLAKFIEQLVVSGGLGLGAWYLITYQPDLITKLAPIFGALVLAVAPLLANQVWHAVTKKG